MIAAVAVVVPARDEQRLLGACLDSVNRAAHHPALAGLPVTVVVVADDCRDRTAPIARRHGAHVVEVMCSCAGAARALGTARALELARAGSATAAERMWLAHTDADSEVPESWLADQIDHERSGSHATVGRVRVEEWSGHTAATAARFARDYELPRRSAAMSPQAVGRRPGRRHRHVHGANLGVRADAYLAVGGFPPLAVGEDHALVTALEGAGYHVTATCDARVTTSARRDPRAPGGFGHFLLDLETRTVGSQE